MKQRHSIDLPFSLSLFMVFVLCAFMVLLLQINGYHRIVRDGENLQSIHTPLAYVKTCIRSNDVRASIDLFTYQDISGIKIIDKEQKSILYIYEHEHQLKELRIIESLTPDFTTGSAMYPIDAFHVEKKGNRLLISLTDSKKQTQDISIRIKSS